MQALPERAACKPVAGAPAIAHERGCEAELAALIEAQLDAGTLPELAGLRTRFSPDPGALPEVTATLAPLSACDALAAASGKQARA